MRSIKSFCLAAAALFAIFIAPVTVAHATEMTWTMTNKDYPEARLKFFTEDETQSWPDDNQSSWSLPDSDPHEITISCEYGQKICFGAWATDGSGTWGVGRAGHLSCDNCCAICGESDPVKSLNPSDDDNNDE